MATQFSTIEEPSFARGIDARSAENQIREGFVRDLVNADIVEGRIKKRRGSAAYAGNLPVRVRSIRQIDATNQLCIAFDSSVDLSRVASCPLIVYGKSSTIGTTAANITSGNDTFTVAGDVFAGASFVYIPASTVTNIPAGYYYIRNRSYSSPNTTFNLSLTLAGPLLVAGSTGTVSIGSGPFTTSGDNLRYYTSWVSNLRKVFAASTIDGTITAKLEEHAINSTDMFVGISETTPSGSETGLTLDGSSLLNTIDINSSTKTITATYTNGTATDQNVFMYYLDRQFILGQTFVSQFVVGSVTTFPHTVLAATHNLNTYNIIYQLYKQVGSGYEQVKPDAFSVNQTSGLVSLTLDGDFIVGTYRLILSSVPASQGSANTLLNNITSPFIFYTAYQYDSASNTYNESIPDTAEYDDAARTWQLTYTATPPLPGTVQVFYQYGNIRANELCVTDTSITTDSTDLAPQLTVYGLDHADIYGDLKQVNRRGWVNHIDSYRSPTTTHMVAGLGGNLFAALSVADTYIPSLMAAAMPTYFPFLNSRVSGVRTIGPAFLDTGDVNLDSPRTRGYITFDTGGTNWGVVTGGIYDTGTGYTKYTISTPNRYVNGTPISIAAGLEDYLTVKNMSSSRHSGTFKIKIVDYSITDTIILSVVNPNIKSIDYNDSATQGLGGVFTDQVTFSATTPFTVGDELLSSAWGEDAQLMVVSSSGSTNVVSQVYDYRILGAGLAVTGKRTSATIPLRTISNVASSSNIVVGDTLSYTGFNRPLQVVGVDSTTHSVTVDESFTWKDDISLPEGLSVARRWVPAEVPVADVADVLIEPTTIQHLSANPYDNQDFLRSAMVQNNMYLTNGSDEVYKYDGRNFYRAGIIPWQPGLFLTVENVASGGIPLAGDSFTVAGSTFSGKTLTVPKADASLVSVNDLVKVTFSKTSPVTVVSLYLTVASITQETSGTDSTVTFKEPISLSFAPDNITVTLAYTARYSFRLNIKDVNGVVTASAVTGAEDFIAQLTPPTAQQQQVQLKLVGLPAWDQYDYSNKNIEVEVYRTLWTTQSLGEVPVFYRIATKAFTFLQYNGYINIVDRYSNTSLSQSDTVVGVLSPDVIPAGWDEPARAKYVTTAGNRLVLGNVTDWPTMALSFLVSEDIAAASFIGQEFLFRRDASDLSSDVTNMLDRTTYELVSSTAAARNRTVHPEVSGATGQFRITSTTALPAGLGANDWLYLYYDVANAGINQACTAALNDKFSSTNHGLAVDDLVHFETPAVGSLPVIGTPGSPLSTIRGYYVAGTVTANDFSISETPGGGALDVTVAGSAILSFAKANPTYCGWWQVFSITGNTITIKDINSTITEIPTHFPNKAAFATDTRDVPVLVDTDGNMAMANGNGPVAYLNITRRLGMAINATMRVTTNSNFVPWLVARSESDTQGQLIVKQPRAENEIPSVVVSWTGARPYSTYINGRPTESGTNYTAAITRYPSRILASYNNYPEIFDNPWTVDTDGSASAIDINSADGQEITGIIPFFGESAFGAALQSGVLVVFKQNSIYLVDLGAKAAGQNAVQRLETQGLGCTAPYSIAPTKDGIAFANDSGVYVLRRNQRIEYLGRFIERNWQEKVDKNFLDIVQGHHYSVGRQYKLSVPMIEDSTSSYAENSQVYVYNHTGEADGETGGWARYTNHPATGWANLFKDAFYANVNGSVLRLRNLGEQTDYRDAASAIESILEARATSFGNTGIRKVVSNCIVHYRTAENSSGTKVYFAPDLYSEYDESTNFSVKTKSAIQDNLSSSQAQAIVSVMHSLVRRRCIYMSVKIINAAKDENVEVAGMSFMVGGLSPGGIKQAADTE